MTIIIQSPNTPQVLVYNSLTADIYTLTARPDLVSETAVALRKATMKAHLADLWKNDLTGSKVLLPVLSTTGATDFRYSLDLTNTAQFPLYRKIASISEYNNPLTGTEIYFEEKDADRILDDYAVEDINYWYQMGKQVSLRANKVLTYLNVNYYKFPNIVPSTYDSWIARDFPDIIIEEAASRIFKTIGKDAEATSYANAFEENLQLLRISEI